MALDEAMLGIDLAGTSDVSPLLHVVGGREGLLEALMRRLMTPRGSLFYDEDDYGYDLRALLNDVGMLPRDLELQVSKELRKDERVREAIVRVTLAREEDLQIDIRIVDADGPFQFTLRATAETVAVLKAA